jgi:biotin carboxylase
VSRRKRILILAATTGYQSRVFAEAAVRLGYDVQMATDRCVRIDDPWGDGAIAVAFHHPEAAARSIADVCRGEKAVDGILAVGDRPTPLAAAAARILGIRYNSPDSVEAARNKYLAHERFRTAGLPVPGYVRVPLDAGPREAASAIRYPCVLKPLGLSASRGVIRADNPREFAEAFERIRQILGSPDILRTREDQDRYLQVEDFIEGREFALEGLLEGGELRVLAIFDKPDDLNGPFFEETIYVTPSREPARVQQAMIETTKRAIRALGLTEGPIHAEMRVNWRGVWMLEVAGRPIGGLCATVLKFDSDDGLEDVLVRHAVGDPIGSTRLRDPARAVMMIPIPREGVYTGVRGLEAARSAPGVEDVVITAKEGQKMARLPEGASYLGFLFARGDTPAATEQALRNAHAQLQFEFLGVLPVMR